MTTTQTLQITGLSFVLGDDVNTDIHCSNKYLPGKDVAYVAQHAFEQLSPNLATQVNASAGGILIAGHHFGINSSREQATHVLHAMNIRAVVAKSFGRQFFRNAINNGLPVFECDIDQIVDGQTLNIDFEKGELFVAGRIVRQTHPLPKEILAILSLGGLIPFLKKYPDWKFA
jgi:3-isopropylmalate/(R)-2-methylmalate dehydratase small subunit